MSLSVIRVPCFRKLLCGLAGFAGWGEGLRALGCILTGFSREFGRFGLGFRVEGFRV